MSDFNKYLVFVIKGSGLVTFVQDKIISGLFDKTSGRITIIKLTRRAGICKCYVLIGTHNPTGYNLFLTLHMGFLSAVE